MINAISAGIAPRRPYGIEDRFFATRYTCVDERNGFAKDDVRVHEPVEHDSGGCRDRECVPQRVDGWGDLHGLSFVK